MLKRIAVALVFTAVAFGQVQYPVEKHLGELTSVKCEGGIPKGFACAILFDVDPPLPSGIDIASVVGGESNSVQVAFPVIRSVSLILNGTLYTATFDPPLNRDDTFSNLRRNAGIPVRIDGDNLVIKWPDGKAAKAKIVRRERIDPNQPQPA